ncbi:hypothetical protein SAMN05660831_00038 [Thiohalospira halophila DSM 15071]|uniref:Outer membrane protein beta-barrel domain-containing protein n=1 Tax=Thiohalospira halophila DSM 15071 TaxID=1123397 RepID=A0A1I1MZ49_9GAMM|nr:hypothetical protein [Thiohalospira halophila]SFC90681.1 hypothetical protein SAMN05660831_00038 [Thiohalospira halophila DSM 15071]
MDTDDHRPTLMTRPGPAAWTLGTAAAVLSLSASAADLEGAYDWMARTGESPTGYWAPELTITASQRDDERGGQVRLEQLSSRASLETTVSLANVPLAGGSWRHGRMGAALGFAPTFRLHWRPVAAGVVVESRDRPQAIEVEGEAMTLEETGNGLWLGTEVRFRVNQRLRVDGAVHQVELGARSGLMAETGVSFALYRNRVALWGSQVLADDELGPLDDTTRFGVRLRF